MVLLEQQTMEMEGAEEKVSLLLMDLMAVLV
jgi:hypothetical protein